MVLVLKSLSHDTAVSIPSAFIMLGVGEIQFAHL
jgi:hypothetical protein